MASFTSYTPLESDYKIWLILNPAKWLVPLWIAALVGALAVHALVFSDPHYDFLNAPAKAKVVK